jgi:hypothetical protein
MSTPDVLRGKPRIKGTRIPVSLILGYLAAGSTFEDIIKEFPDLTQKKPRCQALNLDRSDYDLVSSIKKLALP